MSMSHPDSDHNLLDGGTKGMPMQILTAVPQRDCWSSLDRSLTVNLCLIRGPGAADRRVLNRQGGMSIV